jgi:hypothetical protein
MLIRGSANYKHPEPFPGQNLLIFPKGNMRVSIPDVILEDCLGEPLAGRKVWLRILWKPKKLALVLWPWFRRPCDLHTSSTFATWRAGPHRGTMYFHSPHLRELLGIDNTKPGVGFPMHVVGGRIHVNIRVCETSVIGSGRRRRT